MIPAHDDEKIIGLILKNINGNGTVEDRDTLETWLSESDENKALYTKLYAIITINESSNEESDKAISRINAMIDGYDTAKRHYSSIFKKIGRICAAVAAVIIFACGVFSLIHEYSASETWLTASNDSQETKTIQMADGTKAFLRSGTTIRYSVTGKSSVRSVFLNGEAFFDVNHNAEKPFIVHAKDISVKVLGTAFSVSSKRDGIEPTSVILERGCVKILSPEGYGMVTLKPDQRAVYNADTEDLDVDTFKAKPYLVQKYSLQTIENATLSEIISIIETDYGISISCENLSDTTRYNVDYKKTSKVEDIVRVIEIMTGKQLTIKK